MVILRGVTCDIFGGDKNCAKMFAEIWAPPRAKKGPKIDRYESVMLLVEGSFSGC